MEIRMGTARIINNATIKPASKPGRDATAVRSIFAPDTVKNTGIKKTVGQTVELGLERMVALGDDIAQDKASGKRTQHDVEIKDSRECHERDQDEHRQAHEGLRRGIGALLNKCKEAAADALGAAWDHGQQHANHRKQAKDNERLDASAGRQQHRHGEHGTELAPSAIRENRVAHARAGERALTHDGHKRTERRRSEGKRHGDTVEMTD